MKEEMLQKSNVRALCLSLLVLSFASTIQCSDCFGWSITKRANYMELLPQLLFYD